MFYEEVIIVFGVFHVFHDFLFYINFVCANGIQPGG